ncbi:SigE family RNA polymerase sigma factor [Streptacidiphilus sp. P02-A3a]|uniref:SigE family RNA polymerase sigma factor n=1 Tax=Streptacidiphilus sp. P02-A3a TaxID=2704468 RepID=UPI0015FD3588|nr:SigE family RNA polymerase sigma factor [Streptacidiphilus sp. P02-A3a]QMU68076.1 SigE family RNA polymerase sigma factor [Streptacidiphilus sp. P02-A3a]
MEHNFQEFAVGRGSQLYRTAYLLTAGDSHLAEDLVQEVLGRMFAAWGRLSRLDNPAGYAQTVLVNVFISQRRKRSSGELPTEVLAERAQDPARDGDPALRLTLLASLRQLPPQDRAVLVLRYWEDRSVEETAAALQLSSTAVRSRSSRALERLRGVLGSSSVAELAEH